MFSKIVNLFKSKKIAKLDLEIIRLKDENETFREAIVEMRKLINILSK